MTTRHNSAFATVRSEGGLLPTDFLGRVAKQDRGIPGVRAEDYHVAHGETLGNHITESWNRLSGRWADFSRRLGSLPEDDQGTTLTRERWLLHIFTELGYGRLQTRRSMTVDGKDYPVTHGWEAVPIHLVGVRTPIDRRTPGVRGAAGASPHSMIQELLNRSEESQWAFLSNGRQLRVLRDNVSLTRQAYLEFDLEAMFADQVFEDFVVLWLTCHQSRVEGDDSNQCWLEQWTKAATESGTRARDGLRLGVEAAIVDLGTGFVSHRSNSDLTAQLRSGDLTPQDLYRQLLRVIYRFLFLFVAEDRDLLHSPDATDQSRRRYERYYGIGRLRTLAGRRRGGPHPDLWDSLTVVFRALGRSEGAPSLGLPGLGSFLWSEAATPDLDGARIDNSHLLGAIRHLGFIEDAGERVLRAVDYRNLGAEELGSVYEALLEQHPEVDTDSGSFALNTAAGSERKTTGSYYTPSSLINELLDSAVDPVLDEAQATAEPEQSILALNVIDPACGSGHFLIAAAHRIAKRLASIRTGDDEPSPDATRTALREVIAQCVHGIDINPMAVELCKVSLWLESMEPGKPLSFLDHRIVCGNGLIGATPELLEAGVPDAAFKALTGDDKAVVTHLRKRSKAARTGQGSLLATGAVAAVEDLAAQVEAIDSEYDEDLEAVRAKAARWADLVQSTGYQAAVHAADTWCAAFMAEKTVDSVAITHEQFQVARDTPEFVDPGVRQVVEGLARAYGFLHWHLAFPNVADRGGFDLVLGNPPWEQLQYDPREVFAQTHPEIAAAPNMAARNRMVAKLEVADPTSYARHLVALRGMDGMRLFMHASGRYPLASVGRLNTAPLFLEASRSGTKQGGRVGVIVPSGIATDAFTQELFRELVESRELASLLDFENRRLLFQGAHSSQRFSLLTLVRAGNPSGSASFAFFAQTVDDLHDTDRRFTLSSEDLLLLNPYTGTAPVFRTRRDAEITAAVYRGFPVLGAADGDQPWEFRVRLMFMLNESSDLFHMQQNLDEVGGVMEGNVWESPSGSYLPLYEAKMATIDDHRAADVVISPTAVQRQGQPSPVTDAEHRDPGRVAVPRYWIRADDVERQSAEPSASWFLAYRDVTASTNERSVLVTIVPGGAVAATLRVVHTDVQTAAFLQGCLGSFAFDYIARQKIGGTHLTLTYFEQLPVPTEDDLAALCSGSEFIRDRVVELAYTAWDLESFAIDLGVRCPPFEWRPSRRELLRAELDAAFFHLYRIDRDDVDYIMDTFPIVRRQDEEAHGEYRTKRLILERYDALAEASASGTEYETVLDPPPADPRVAHPESTRPNWAPAPS
jgi:hypothetical protein